MVTEGPKWIPGTVKGEAVNSKMAFFIKFGNSIKILQGLYEDDNGNGEVDCQESQCGGQVCGKTTVEISDGNLTKILEKESLEAMIIKGNNSNTPSNRSDYSLQKHADSAGIKIGKSRSSCH